MNRILGESRSHTSDFRVGEWLVQPGLNRISRVENVVQIEPKVMDVFCCLAQSAPNIVTREELLAEVWGKRFVSESVLTRAIAMLRHCLGDSARNPRFIETVSKRGYRMIAPVKLPSGFSAQSSVYYLLVDERRVPLVDGENLIGRDEDVHIRIESASASRHHARIIVEGEYAWIEDLGSKNGTFCGSTRIIEKTPVKDGDLIRLGPVVVIFRHRIDVLTTQTSDGREGSHSANNGANRGPGESERD